MIVHQESNGKAGWKTWLLVALCAAKAVTVPVLALCFREQAYLTASVRALEGRLQVMTHEHRKIEARVDRLPPKELTNKLDALLERVVRLEVIMRKSK